MRIAPILIPHLRTGTTNLWVDTALCGMLTHNDRLSTSACVAFTAMLWDLLDMSGPPAQGWWLQRYVEITRELEGDTSYSPRGGRYTGYAGPAWKYIEDRVSDALNRELETVDACNSWFSGAFLLETIPSVLYILERHGSDFEEAVVRAVNDTKDNDTVAAIVGAAAGALHGRGAIPKKWLDDLTGRTGSDDDGKVFSLVEASRAAFWEATPD